MKAWSTTLLVTVLCIAPGCSVGGSKSARTENDALRRRIMELEHRSTQLEGEKAELASKVRERARLDATIDPEALEALPRLTRVDIDALSGFVPADPTSPASSVVIAFAPKDGRGRFVQVAGTARVEALMAPGWIETGSRGEPRRLGVVTLAPLALRDAYRAGFGGSYYEATVPLDAPIDRSGKRPPVLILRVELSDAITGTVQTAERVVGSGK